MSVPNSILGYVTFTLFPELETRHRSHRLERKLGILKASITALCQKKLCNMLAKYFHTMLKGLNHMKGEGKGGGAGKQPIAAPIY